MKIEQFECDVCHRAKGEENGWIEAEWRPKNGSSIQFMPWGFFDDSYTVVRHICSLPCATKALSSWMDEVHKAGRNAKPV